MKLLDKARDINFMLQKTAGKAVNFNNMSDTLQQVIESNIFIVSRRGKLLGVSINQAIENDRMKQMLEEKQFPKEYTEGLFQVQQTTANIGIDSPYTAFPVENKVFPGWFNYSVPIIGGGEASVH